jgi:hypothetical protein
LRIPTPPLDRFLTHYEHDHEVARVVTWRSPGGGSGRIPSAGTLLPHLAETGRTAEGVVGRPAALFVKDDGRPSG